VFRGTPKINKNKKRRQDYLPVNSTGFGKQMGTGYHHGIEGASPYANPNKIKEQRGDGGNEKERDIQDDYQQYQQPSSEKKIRTR